MYGTTMDALSLVAASECEQTSARMARGLLGWPVPQRMMSSMFVRQPTCCICPGVLRRFSARLSRIICPAKCVQHVKMLQLWLLPHDSQYRRLDWRRRHAAHHRNLGQVTRGNCGRKLPLTCECLEHRILAHPDQFRFFGNLHDVNVQMLLLSFVMDSVGKSLLHCPAMAGCPADSSNAVAHFGNYARSRAWRTACIGSSQRQFHFMSSVYYFTKVHCTIDSRCFPLCIFWAVD